jgi:riboflavin kinase/FMN adenylyltransferase
VKIHAGLDDFKVTRAVVTIGMFDGIHVGHRGLLNETIKKAQAIEGESVIITFWPHPRLVLNKDSESLRFLTSLEEKTMLFSQLGIDHLVILPFNTELAQLTAAQFTTQILVNQIHMKHLIVGYNHRFGSDGYLHQTNYELLGQELGFEVTRIAPVEAQGEKASSTAIRQHLEKGNIKEANTLLGYPYLITGRVVGGQRLGRTLGFPTANIEIEESAKLIPLDGVYACKVHAVGSQYNGMLNIGFRPTVSTQKDFRTIEVHILDFNRDIYSEEITIEFIDRVRNEMQFTGIESLKEQLKQDEKSVRQRLMSF